MLDKRPTILVVDDEPAVCDFLCKGLSERGYLCRAALNGSEALCKLGTGEFQVVLLDIRLPGMSGMEVLQDMQVKHCGVATIMITAVNDVVTAVQAMRLGASDYLVKPFDLEKVYTSVQTALGLKQAAKKSSVWMDAIARSVEARLDPFLAYSRTVAEGTIDIARKLGIAEEEIQSWAVNRARIDSEKEKVVTRVHLSAA